MLESVQKVDVITNGFDWWNAAFGAAGFVAAAVAIVIAVRSNRRADKTLTEERRRVFELELLREFAKDVDAGLDNTAFFNPEEIRKYDVRLSLLSSRLRFWDTVATLTDSNQVAAEVGFPELQELRTSIPHLEEGLRVLPETVKHLQVASPDLANRLVRSTPWITKSVLHRADHELGREEAEGFSVRLRAGETEAGFKRNALLVDIERETQGLERELAKQREQCAEVMAAAKGEFRRRLTEDIRDAIDQRMAPTRRRPHE